MWIYLIYVKGTSTHVAKGLLEADNPWKSYIASVILVDAYPRGMHRKSIANSVLSETLIEKVFDPELLYDHIYRPLCVQSLVASSKNESLVPHQNQAIRDH